MNSLVTMVKYPLIHFSKSAHRNEIKDTKRKQLNSHEQTNERTDEKSLVCMETAQSHTTACVLCVALALAPPHRKPKLNNQQHNLLANKQIDKIGSREKIREEKRKVLQVRLCLCLSYQPARLVFLIKYQTEEKAKQQRSTHSDHFLR